MGFALSDMTLTSSAFEPHGAIPAKHTGDAEDVSPALAWSEVPEGTKSFALICHDPDAPLVTPGGTYGFVHWVLYNIPGSTSSLEEGTSEFTCGINDFGNQAYGGPMPPPGHGKHQEDVWGVARGERGELEAGLPLRHVLARSEPTLIGMTRLGGTFERT